MVSRIEVRNWLSYDEASVDIDSNSIAVVGDNGTGKSSLLEALPFAYYGTSRYQYPRELCRLGGDGTFRVRVHHVDDRGSDTVVERGFKKRSYVKVTVNGDTVAEGPEADEYIVNMLGMSEEMFMLTAYFGLGDSPKSDMLLKVEPGKCLDTLQSIAGVSVYRKFAKSAKERQSEILRKATRIKGSLDVLNEQHAEEDLEELKQDLGRWKAKNEALQSLLREQKSHRDQLLDKESAYIAFVRERDSIDAELKALRDAADEEADRVAGEETSEKRYKKKVDTAVKERERIQNLLDDVGSLDRLSENIESQMEEKARKHIMYDLKSVATALEAVKECPLCEQTVTEEILSKWESDVVRISGELKELQDKIDIDSETLNDSRTHGSTIAVLSETIRNNSERAKTSSESIKKGKRSIWSRQQKMESLARRRGVVDGKLGSDYDKLSKSIQKVGMDIEETMRKMVEYEGKETRVRESIKRYKERETKIRKVGRDLSDANTKLEAVNLLVDGFSRYGIPRALLDSLNNDIMSRATSIYREFDNGEVVIEEVPGKKPGLRFVLNDRRGLRSFRGLSLGERAMFYVAVRVAVAEIVSAMSNVNVGFIVLDEGSGNLSPRSRENLIRLINKVLRRMFPIVIMTSHVPMPDIFSQIIEVSLEEDVSTVNVC